MVRLQKGGVNRPALKKLKKQIGNKINPKESKFLETGKVFSAKIPPKLAARIEETIEEHEFQSNSEFVKFAIRMTLPLLEDTKKGYKLFAEDKDGNISQYRILG